MKRALIGSALIVAVLSTSGCAGLGALGSLSGVLGHLPSALPTPGSLPLPGGGLPSLPTLHGTLPTPGFSFPHSVPTPLLLSVPTPGVRPVPSPAAPFTGQESFPIAGARHDVLDVLATVGRTQGYSVYSRNDDLGSLVLLKTWAGGIGPWRKHSSIVLTLQVQDRGHSLCVASQAGGDGKGYDRISEKAEKQFRAGVEANLR